MGNKLNTERLDTRRRSLEEIIQHSHCYKELAFTWNATKRGRNIRFLEDKVKSYGKWGLCMPSSLVISDQNCIEYEFEIKIENDSHEKGSSIMMGFIYHSLTIEDTIDYNNNLMDIDDSKQFVFQIGYGKDGEFQFYGKNKGLSDSAKLPFTFSDDDTFKLRINFKRKDIELYYNDTFVATIFNRIESKIKLIPCIALKNAQIELLSSKYVSPSIRS